MEVYDRQMLFQDYFAREQKFISYAVAANGIHLWKSMMQERYKWVKGTN
jgi:hypothetical protein